MATVPPEPVLNPYFPCRPGEGVIVAWVGAIDALMGWFPVRRPQCSGHGTGTICCRSGPPRPTQTVPSGQGSGGRPWRGGKNRVGRGVGTLEPPLGSVPRHHTAWRMGLGSRGTSEEPPPAASIPSGRRRDGAPRSLAGAPGREVSFHWMRSTLEQKTSERVHPRHFPGRRRKGG